MGKTVRFLLRTCVQTKKKEFVPGDFLWLAVFLGDGNNAIPLQLPGT